MSGDDALPPPMGLIMRQATQTNPHGGEAATGADDALPPPLMGGLMRQATQTDAHGAQAAAAPALAGGNRAGGGHVSVENDDSHLMPPLMGSLMRQATESHAHTGARNPHAGGAAAHGGHDDKGGADNMPPPQLTLLKHPTIADAHGQVSLLSPASRQTSGTVSAQQSAAAAAAAAAAGAGDGKTGDPYFSARHLQSFARVGAPVPSPSGRHVVFTVKSLRNAGSGVGGDVAWYHEENNNSFVTQLYLADIGPALSNAKTLHPSHATGGAASAGAGADVKSSHAVSAAVTAALYDGHVRKLTSPPEKKSDMEPLWLDDSTVAFLSTRSGSPQIYSISIHGGEAQQVSNYPVAIEHLRFNPARSFVAFSASVYTNLPAGTVNVLAETAKKDADAAKKPAKFHKYDKLFTRRWDTFVDAAKRAHLFVQPIHKSAGGSWALGATPVDVMAGVDADAPQPPFGDIAQYAISPFGDELAYATHSVQGKSEVAWSTAVKIYTVKIDLHHAAAAGGNGNGNGGGKTVVGDGKNVSVVVAAGGGGRGAALPTVTLTAGAVTNVSALLPGATAGNDHSPSYSPDGKFLLYLSMRRPQFEADRNRLMCFNRATKQTVELSPAWSLSPSAVAWTADSATLVLSAELKAHNAIWLLSVKDALSNKALEPSAIVTRAWNTSVSVLNAHWLVFSRDSFAAPAEVFACKLNDGTQLTRLTAFNDSKLSQLPHALPNAEEFYATGAKNEPVQNWLFKPVGFDLKENTGKKWPVACVIHGGPQGAVGDHWHYRWNPHVLTAHGFAVVIPNFHGSTGFGQPFTDAISGDWGGAPFVDIMASMDHALKQNSTWMDANKQVALGASFGGYMINWVNANTNRFKALVNHDGVFDQVSMYYTTEELYFCEFEFGGKPSDPHSVYAKFSPHNFVDKMNTPTLVIHGGKDYRVPDAQGLATFTALQRRGIPSELLYFPDENHWVLQPANSVVWHQEVTAWIKKWVA